MECVSLLVTVQDILASVILDTQVRTRTKIPSFMRILIGKNCEYLTTVQLVGQYPYIEVDPLFTSRALNLTVVLKTKEPSGVILYHGDKDHLAVELFHGRVRVSLNVGNDPSSTMFRCVITS